MPAPSVPNGELASCTSGVGSPKRAPTAAQQVIARNDSVDSSSDDSDDSCGSRRSGTVGYGGDGAGTDASPPAAVAAHATASASTGAGAGAGSGAGARAGNCQATGGDASASHALGAATEPPDGVAAMEVHGGVEQSTADANSVYSDAHSVVSTRSGTSAGSWCVFDRLEQHFCVCLQAVL